MRNRRLLLQMSAGFGCASSLLLAALLTCGIVWPALRPTPTPQVRPFQLRDLFVNLSTISPHCWIYEGPLPFTYEENAGAEEALFAWFRCLPSGRGAYAIYRFQNAQTAARRYHKLGWFYNADRVTPYEVPEWMHYQSSVADRFQFACADFYGGYPRVYSRRCASIAQYEEYIVSFSFSISPPESMSNYASFLEGVLQAIDIHMKDYLSR